MKLNPTKKTSDVFLLFWPWFFFAAAFESLVAIVSLLLIPSEGGISLARAGMLIALIAFLLIAIYLGWIARHNLSRFDKFANTPYLFASALLFLTSSLLLFLLRYLNPERLLPFYARISPLLWYLIALGIQSTVFLLLLKNGFHSHELANRRPIYVFAIISFLFLLFVLFFVAITKIGITADTGYWGEPGVAIQGWQFALSILIGFLTLLYSIQLINSQSLTARYLIPVLIYFTAVSLWLSVPWTVLANSFYSPISPPLNIPLPYSDAGFYDFASQSLLIGTKYFGGIPPRPLYVVFLAFLHFLFGQNYPAIISAQTCVLALFPVALYFLAKKLHSPSAGVTVALFAIFREQTGLWISSMTRVANSKMLTTDFPTAFGIVILCLVTIWWLERRDVKSALVAGGSFGLLLLFRTQSFLILPVLFILAWFVYQGKIKMWLISGLAFCLMMTLTVLPWLTHNRIVSGHFTFDDPKQVAIIYSQYSFTGNLNLSQFDPEKESAGQRMISFTRENPAYVANFVTSHFLNTEIGGLLALPLIEPFNGLFAPVNLYWMDWHGSLEWYNLILIIIYLAVIAIGLGAAWRRLKWIGLIPLAFNLGYALANGIARFSSWRYNLPVDWVIYFYFGIGLVEIFGGVTILFGAKSTLFDRANEPIVAIAQKVKPNFVFLLSAFIIIGSLPWLGEGLAKPRYISNQDEMISKLMSDGYNRADIQTFLANPKSHIYDGRMLYPRLYRRNEGIASANPWPAYKIQDFARIGFVLINDNFQFMIFPTKDLLPFQQGADTIVLACDGDGVLVARLVDFGNQSFLSSPLSDACP